MTLYLPCLKGVHEEGVWKNYFYTSSQRRRPLRLRSVLRLLHQLCLLAEKHSEGNRIWSMLEDVTKWKTEYTEIFAKFGRTPEEHYPWRVKTRESGKIFGVPFCPFRPRKGLSNSNFPLEWSHKAAYNRSPCELLYAPIRGFCLTLQGINLQSICACIQ